MFAATTRSCIFRRLLSDVDSVGEEALLPTFFNKLDNDEPSGLALFAEEGSSSWGRFADPFTPYGYKTANSINGKIETQ